MTDWSTHPQAIGGSQWAFPPASQWPDSDVIALGGGLDPGTLIAAYRQGLFPMPLAMEEGGALAWWSPEPRGVMPLESFRVTHSMKQSAKRFEVRVDTAFEQVIRACANPARESAWISAAFIDAYTMLHRLGWAHSIEVFDRQGTLAGGLYGVRVNGLFAGESMFYLQRDASKVALMALVRLMREAGMTLLDVQWRTEHLGSLGAIEIDRADYLARLDQALRTASTGE
jgi:leucyl/phenylalanyl-tRNA--protein transferase